MLPLSLVTLGLAIIGAYAKSTVRPGGGLELSLSTPANKVASASDLRVSATVRNAGDDGVKILKLGTVLDSEHPTRPFIVSKDGKEVPFIGTTYPTPADGLSENDWVVIPAGKNVTAEHDVSALYDFLASGLGTFTFDSVSRFQVIGVNDSVETTSDATPVDIANVRSVSVSITDDLSKREIVNECGSDKHYLYIEDGIRGAEYMAYLALEYIAENQDPDGFYKTYFGTNPTSNVTHNFRLIWEEGTHTVNAICLDPICSAEGRDVINPAGSDNIYFCSSYFSQDDLPSLCNKDTAPTARKIRAGTVLRMLARTFVPGVAGEGRTCDGARELSDFGKITNNLNYECFAVEVYAKLAC